MKSIRTIAFILFAAGTVAMIFGGPARADSRGCGPTGQERYTFHVDGVLTGVFNQFEKSPEGAAESTATYQDGILFRGSYVQDWLKNNQGKPVLTELHDILVYRLSNQLDILDAIVELIDSDVTQLDAVASLDNPSCLIVKTLRLKIGKTTVPKGIVRP